MRHCGLPDQAPGIRRKRSAGGFRYVDTAGRPLRDQVTLARIKRLAIPPAWSAVWISPKANGGKRLGSLDTSRETWGHVFQVNFFAPIMLARGLMDELKTAKGAVVNVTSIAGSRVHPFAGAAYGTSKAALAALTREMAADFGPLGIRVNAIAPGEIDTSILSPGTEKIVEEQIPMRRLGTIDEVADVIHFLCEKGASYVSGAEIQINGGQHV